MKKLALYQLLSLFLVVQLLLVKLVSNFPNQIEQYYSNGVLSSTRTFTGTQASFDDITINGDPSETETYYEIETSQDFVYSCTLQQNKIEKLLTMNLKNRAFLEE